MSVLTAIGLDHLDTLGDTLAAIAGEKADVIKPGGIAVTAPQAPEALAVLRAVAKGVMQALYDVPESAMAKEIFPDSADVRPLSGLIV